MQLFLVYLLELLASQPCFYLRAVDLIVGLTSNEAVLMALEIVVGLSGWFL